MPEVLVVCTANICRSPLVAALLTSWIGQHAPSNAHDLRVTSAGVRARDGNAASARMTAIADRWGLDLHAHASRPFDPHRDSAVDLVITMEASHRDTVARAAPGLATGTFTLPELAQLIDHVAPQGHEGLRAWVLAMDAARRRVRIETTDVEDPYGGPAAGYELTAAELASLVERVAPSLIAALGSTSSG